MSTTPWRGTIIFVGGIAAIAATAATRFAGADTATPALAGSGSSTTQGTGSTAAGTTTNSGSSSSSPAATPSSKAASTSGTVTVVGSTVQTPYGPLQLSVTFNGSKITSVQALQYPNWHGESVRINQYAIPQLTQEAVAAGSANINGISGATFTSQAYVQSLQAAIDQHG